MTGNEIQLDEISNVVLSIRMTKLSGNRIKFEVLKVALPLGEQILLKKFIREKVLTGNYDKYIDLEK